MPTYSLTIPQTPPTTIKLRAVDTDIITSSGSTEGTTEIRSGRARLINAIGSELLDLPVPFRIEYWLNTTSSWQLNSADICTTITAANFAFSFPPGSAATRPNNLNPPCKTALSIGGSGPNYTLTLSKPLINNDGWTDMTLNLGAPTGTQCSSVGGIGPAATTANRPWLQYNWSGAVGNPQASATFGVFKAPVIYKRENY